MAAIFISHSSRDNETAAEIKSWLSEQGYENVFLDFDKDTGLGAGRDWERQLYEAVERCHAMILVVTPAWLESKWCFAEERIGRALGKSIFPIVRTPDDIKIIGPELHNVQAALWNVEGQGHLQRRLAEIATEIARGHRFDPSRPPWPGIFSFEAEDAAVFFGRDPEIRKVAELLEARRLQGGARLLLIVGASGSGKSSLMKAGVLPYVSRDRRRFIALPPFRPGAAPLSAFAKSFAEALGRAAEWQAIFAVLIGDKARAALTAFLEELRIGPARDATVLVAIDQFEEAFTVADLSERKAFFDLLTAATDRQRPLPLLVLATVRSDLLGELLRAEDFAVPHGTWTLGPLSADRLAEVIEGPAQVAAIGLESGFSQRILQDVGSPEALPLLAFALRELNERYGADKRLSILEYEQLGDRTRRLSPLENAVRRKAEETLAAAAPAPSELLALKEAFVGALVRVNDEGVRLRRLARLTDLPEAARVLVGRLVDARLLSTRAEGEESLVEVAHEALFRAWPQLSAWLDEEQDFLIGRRQIEEAERIWATAPAIQKDKALLAGLLLEKAREWSISYPERLRNVRDYVLTSIRRDDAERAAAKRRQRALTFASIAAALVFAVLGVLTAVQWNRAASEASRAEEQAQRAERERQAAEQERNAALVTQSRFLADLANQHTRSGDAASGILLGLEALPQAGIQEARPYTPEAEAALYRARSVLRETRVLAHRDVVGEAAFSPNGAHIVTGSSDGVVQIWNAMGDWAATLEGHSARITSASFSPDSNLVLTASEDKTARVWNAENGELLVTLSGHTDEVSDARFSPDAERIVTASRDGTARIWEASRGTSLFVLRGDEGWVTDASFSPDGKFVVTASHDYTARIWDPTTGLQIKALEGHTSALWGAEFSPDGRLVLTFAMDKSVRVWNIDTGQVIAILKVEGSFIGARFTPDGTRIVGTDAGDEPVWTWDFQTGSRTFVESEGWTREVVLSPDATLLAPVSGKNMEIIDYATREKLLALGGHFEEIVDAAFSPDGTRVLTTSLDGTARLWNLGPDTANVTLKVMPDCDVLCTLGPAFLDPAGATVLTASREGAALWDAVDGSLVSQLTRSDATMASFSRDGGRVVIAQGSEIVVWDLGGNRLLFRVQFDSDPIEYATFSKSGTMIAIASWNGTASLLSAGTGMKIRTFTGHTDAVYSIAFSPDESRVLTASLDGTARIWDVRSGETVRILLGHSDRVFSAAFSPDGRTIAAASADETIRLWDSETGNVIAVVEGHNANVYSVAFDKDGLRFVTASQDGTAAVWRTDLGKVTAFLEGHRDWVTDATFSADGHRVVTSSKDGTVRIWRVYQTVVELIDDAKAVVPRCLTREQREAMYLDADPPAWCIEMEKWPYQGQEWKDWLGFKRSSLDPPLPETQEWQRFVTEHPVD